MVTIVVFKSFKAEFTIVIFIHYKPRIAILVVGIYIFRKERITIFHVDFFH